MEANQVSIQQTAHRFHFISGLPRSGSTLLAALLRQNPRFHAAMSSPVAGLINTLLDSMSAGNEYSVFIDDAQRKRILRGVVEGYYQDCSAEVVFDTNRAWCAKIGLTSSLFPGARMIACVRELPWILDSIERLVQGNLFQPSAIFNHRSDGTIYSRAEGLTSNEGMVGAAYNALKQAFYGEHSGALMLLQYETLTNNPARAMAEVYSFLGESAFPHDFECVAYDAREYDYRAGTPGLHDIRPVIEPVARTTIVPPDLIQRYDEGAFWRVPSLNTRQVIVV